MYEITSSSRDGIASYVQEITLHNTVTWTLQNKKVLIQNSKMNEKTIINKDIGIDYTSNIDSAVKIVQKGIQKHPSSIDGWTTEEKILVYFK
ncbi:MAG: hypothetical protein ABI045_01265 [Flavobacteriales bacterium]